MYEPDEKSLSFYNFKDENFDLFKVSETKMIECDTLASSLKELEINFLDYLKIDTQGAEFEILKGLENYRPLMIKCEIQIFPMYKEQPKWIEIVKLLYELDYILIDWKKIGPHATRTPVEMDMIFIPNFKTSVGKKLILKKEKQFISLMLMTGQLKLLQKISKFLNLNNSNDFMHIEDKFLINMAIFDCFQYFNEDHIVDLRLNILNKFVDKFIIVESTVNHQGKKNN